MKGVTMTSSGKPSVFITKHSITLHWWKAKKEGSADFMEKSLRPGGHLRCHERANLRIDYINKDGEDVRYELSYQDSGKRKRLIEVLSGDEWQKVEIPYILQDAMKFRVMKRIYLVELNVVIRRRSVRAMLGESPVESDVNCPLFYPSGSSVMMQRSRNEDGQAYLWHDPSDLSPGIEIADFVPTARIIGIDGNRVTVSPDQSLWKEER